VGKKDPNEVICIPSQRAEPGLITSKGYTSKELEAGEVFVLRRYFSRYFKVPTCSTLTYLYPL
ncbi:hypothetical protein L249_8350, partial [Ophiocordyceps polyrhachis-furcata BCC 54312]